MYFQEYDHLPEEKQLAVLTQLRNADWRGAHFLYDLLRQDGLDAYSGPDPRLLLLMQEECILSFCVLGVRDEIHDTELSPWIGFVYTFPRYRGHRCSQKVIDYTCSLARQQGHSKIYISSNEYGLYEKYSFRYLDHMRNVRGELTQVFVRDL